MTKSNRGAVLKSNTALKNGAIIIVAGPTASGKTDFAITLAKDIGGELINADSRQVYKELNIGTNKGVLVPLNTFIKSGNPGILIQGFDVENSGVSGWMFDLVYPDQEFNLAMYKKYAEIVIDNILARGKTPILVGGTGLYINSIIYNFDLKDEEIENSVRQTLNSKTLIELQDELKKLSIETFNGLNQSDVNNPRRLIRYIEKELTKSGPASRSNGKYDYDFYYPEFDKEKLFEKIDQRVIKMMNEGLIEETENAIKKGWGNTKVMQSMTYKEVQDYLNGKIGLEKCTELIKLEVRKYAKRQMTWFRKYS